MGRVAPARQAVTLVVIVATAVLSGDGEGGGEAGESSSPLGAARPGGRERLP